MKIAELELLGVPKSVLSVIPDVEECTGIPVLFRDMDASASARLGSFIKSPAVLDIDAEAQSITIWLKPGERHAHTITHELIHLERHILESVPLWNPSSQTPPDIDGFVWQMESELEHLFIVPKEIGLHAAAERYWTELYDRLMANAASRKDGFALCLHWAFLRTTMCTSDDLLRRCVDHLRSLSSQDWLKVANNYQCDIKAAMPSKSDLMTVQLDFCPPGLPNIRESLHAGAVRCIGR